jgi:putative transposase
MRVALLPSIPCQTLGVLPALAAALSSLLKSRTALQVETWRSAIRSATAALSERAPQLTAADRFLWAWLCGVWRDWRSALVIVEPETVVAWHRKGFRLF